MKTFCRSKGVQPLNARFESKANCFTARSSVGWRPGADHGGFMGLIGLLVLGLLFSLIGPVEAQAASPVYVFSHLAGPVGGVGDSDGMGAAAHFNSPSAAAIDVQGNIYVADFRNNTIRKITPGGVVSTFVGSPGKSGSVDGTGHAARFSGPQGLAIDSTGNVYVVDRYNHTIRKVTPAGLVTTFAGAAGQSGTTDGVGAAARFNIPACVALDGADNLYISDTANQTIRKITPDGTVTTVAGSVGQSGSADGTGTAARFNGPYGIAVDSHGNIYVGDFSNRTIRKITQEGVVTTIAGSAGVSGSVDGAGIDARFMTPTGLALDSADNLYVADYNNTIRKITTPADVATVTTLAGTAGENGSADGTGAAARFYWPSGLAVDSGGFVYVTDGNNNMIRKIGPGGVVTTLAGSIPSAGSADGTGTSARFNRPNGIAADSGGNIYVADSYDRTIRKITPGGAVTTVAGIAGEVGHVDATGTAARFGFPADVAVDNGNNVYVADAYTVRKITPEGVVNTFAAGFNSPQGLAVDSAGTVYVADTLNHRICRVTSVGIATTLAGASGEIGSTDGAGADARFNNPSDVAIDSSGNLYVADTNNHTIRKIVPSGAVTTFAGNVGHLGMADGRGTSARFYFPAGITVDSADNLYVADYYNRAIRKITPTGTVTTVGGSTAQLAGADDGLGIGALFNNPHSLAVDGADNLYVADAGNHAIRKGQRQLMPEPTITWATPASITFGTPLSDTQLNATADVPGTFVYNPPSGRVLSVGSHTLDLTVTPTDDVNFTAAYGQRSISVNKAASTISLEGLSAIFDGTAKTVSASVHDLVVTTFAGSLGFFSSTLPFRFDEVALAARFSGPWGAAFDISGNMYVADGISVRKITPAGMVTTIAGDHYSSGSIDGTGSAARFNGLCGVAVDSAGNLYVADSGNNTIRKITSAGVVTTFAGLAGSPGSADGIGTAARFNQPSGVAVDEADNIYLPDRGNHTIRKITPTGEVTTFVGLAGNPGSADGSGSDPRLNSPSGLAVDSVGYVYVADTGNSTIRKITAAGVVTTLAGTAGSYGTTDGAGSAARFEIPDGVAVDGSGNVYVADGFSRTIRKITPDGMVTTPAGTAGVSGLADGAGAAAQFTSPYGLAADGEGNVYVTDTNARLIRKITGVSGTFTVTYDGSSTAPTAAGSYTVIATLNDPNYAGSASGTLVISKATAAVTLGSLSATYDGSIHAATAITMPAALAVNFTYDGSSTAPTNAGTYAVVGTINDSNYQGSTSGILTISKATPVLSWGNPSAITYGTALSAAQLNATSSVAGTFVYSPASGTVMNAGTQSVNVTFTPTDSANYNGATKSVDFTVNKATPVVTWAAPSAITYGTALAATQLNATVGIAGTFVYSPAAGAVLNAGTQSLGATFTPTDSANYNGATKSVNLTVNKVALMVTAVNKSRIYGAADPVFTGVLSGFVNGDTASVVTGSPAFAAQATSTSTVGVYAIIPTAGTLAANNYCFSPFNNGTLTVTKATLTVTADNKSKLQGTANPALTVSYAGFVNGDAAASLMTQPVPTTTAVLSSPIGSYPITLNGGVSTNYSFTYLGGTLSVVAESIAPRDAVITIAVE